jgi:ParB/RepB/Spo0J family partition protein
MTTVAEPRAIKNVFALPTEAVFPNPDNPRRVTDAHPSLPGLAEAIKSVGQLQPIVAIRKPDGTGWMIVAGERRWRACRLGGIPTVEASVVEADEAKAFTMTVVENLQREDLHWLEEARGVESMTKRGWDVATIAKSVGRSEQWVRLRAKLAGISPAWIKAVEDPKHDLHGWPAAMLEQVARFPIATQDEMLKEDHWELIDTKTVAELRTFLERGYLRSLSAASWDLADAKLVPKAGACSACPKRTSCQQQLFAEAKDDRCTDAACWKAKTAAHVVAAVETARKAEPKTLVIGHAQGLPPAIAKQVKHGHEYEIAGPKTKGAMPAVFTSGEAAGTSGWVVKKTGYGGGDVTNSRPAAKSSAQKSGGILPKVRLAQFLKRRTRAAVGLVIEKLGGKRDATSVNHWGQPKDCAADVTRPPRFVLMAFAAAYGITGTSKWDDHGWKAIGNHREMADDALDAATWEQVRRTLISRLIADKQFRGQAAGAELVAKACGLNWPKIVAGVRDAMPLPKTLALHFDQDGKPLTGLLAKAMAKEAAPKPGRAGRPKPPAKPKASASAAKR